METINFEYEFVKKHPNRVFLLRYMREAIGKESELEFSDMTARNLTAIVDYIKSKVTANSASNYCTLIKSFLNMMDDEVELPTKKFASFLSVKKEPQQNVALTEDEVERIYAYYKELLKKSRHQVEKDVLTLFLIECYCGARGVDSEAIDKTNIDNGRLTYVSKKTHILATMPVHYRLAELLRRKPKRTFTRSSKNRVIKRVCQSCGINSPVTIFYHGEMQTRPKYEFCAFHTARRSFAPVLAAKGVPIPEIAQYMSHTNTLMTQRYIKVEQNISSAAALSFFNKH